MVQALEPVRSMQHAPVAQVAFILQNTPEVEFEPHLGEVEISGFTQAPPPAAKFELAFECVETDGGLEGNVFYATQVFDQQRWSVLLLNTADYYSRSCRPTSLSL